MGFDHKAVRDEGPVPHDESLDTLAKQRNYSLIFVVSVAVIIGGWFAYQAWQARHVDPDDKLMLEQAETIRQAIVMYHMDNADYPVSLEQVGQYLPTDNLWPKNPYNGETIKDTGSKEFDPAISPGMVCFERIVTTGKAGYALHVFSDDGKLDVLWGGYYVEK